MCEKILLIGLRDAGAVKAAFEARGNLGPLLTCDTLEQAEDVLLNEAVSLFVLDTQFEEAAIYAFYQWVLDNKPTYGALLGDTVNDWLCINSINSHIIVQYALRPVTSETCLQVMEAYYHWYNLYRSSMLKRVQGMKLYLQSRK